MVSVWEILVKCQLGKLSLPAPADEYIRSRRGNHEIASLTLDEPSLGHLARLPLHHRDPFDRMLICQAIHHDLVIATVDPEYSPYPVQILSLT